MLDRVGTKDIEQSLDDVNCAEKLLPGTSPRQTTQYQDRAAREKLLEALERNRYNLTRTARDLGACHATLYNRLNRYGISPDAQRKNLRG